MALYDIDKPALGSMTLRLPNVGPGNGPAGPSGIELNKFLEYSYSDNFLTPVDGGEFSIDARELSDADRAAIGLGAKCEIAIDGNVQAVGWLDEVRIRSSRGGGSIWTLPFRQWLSPAVDCHVDPQTRLSASQSLADLLMAVFEPFDVTNFEIDNTANRNAITGAIYGTKSSKKGKPLKSIVLHQIKPYDQEGAFAFASRVSQRFGLWLWPAADGKTLIVGQPDFLQDPRYTLVHRTDAGGTGTNNVLEAEVTYSRKDQPSLIFASGAGGGGEFAKATLKGGIINPLIVNGADLVRPIISVYPNVNFTTLTNGYAIPPPNQFIPWSDPLARPLYLKDTESHTQDELYAFLRRELSLRLQKALTAQYTIEGHTLNGQPICVDTIVSVEDDVTGLKMPMWILERHFSKAAGDTGTKTRITCILPGALQF